jgi:integrase
MGKEAKFFLDKPKSESLTHIFLLFTCNDKLLKFSTQEKIKPLDWDFENQRAFANKKVNTELNRLYSICEQYQESCRKLFKPILKEELKSELSQKTHREEKTKEILLSEAINTLISEAKSGKLLTKKGKKYVLESLRSWGSTQKQLQEFNSDLTFNNITLETYFDFIDFCNKKNFSLNYTGKLIKDWKTFMEHALIKKWHKNTIYKHPQFKKLQEEVGHIYLTEKEIEKIKNVDLSEYGKIFQIIRDRFVINLYTGLRISDMKTFTEKNIQNDNIIHINKKTGKKVVIPLHPIVKGIMFKYKNKLPYQYNDIMVNDYIKKIAKKAGLIDTVRYNKTIGGITKEFIAKKWQLITTHTCRRSFTTNLLKYADAIDVMPVTGMSLKTLQLYNKRTAEENAEMLKENEFFKKK